MSDTKTSPIIDLWGDTIDLRKVSGVGGVFTRITLAHYSINNLPEEKPQFKVFIPGGVVCVSEECMARDEFVKLWKEAVKG